MENTEMIKHDKTMNEYVRLFEPFNHWVVRFREKENREITISTKVSRMMLMSTSDARVIVEVLRACASCITDGRMQLMGRPNLGLQICKICKKNCKIC